MANKRVGRKRASPPCWTLPFFAAIFVFKVYFLTADPAEEEPWYGEDNSTDHSVSRVGRNDTQAREFMGLDEDLLVLLRSGPSMDEGSTAKSTAAMVCGAVSIFCCLMILLAYGDIEKVKGLSIRSFNNNLKCDTVEL